MALLGFIGTGNMGGGMAARLLEAGHRLRVFNRTAARAQALADRGAEIFATPRAACAGVEAVFCMVADDPASRAVWLGDEGILAANVTPGAFAVECSTLSHDWVLDLSARARERGLRYLDAPVTGLPAAAAAGDLTLLVGADLQDLEAARGWLAPLNKQVFHFGPPGTGTAYKLIINLLGAVQIASAAESMALAQKAGLDLHLVADAIASGQAASPQVVRNTRRMADEDHVRQIAFTPRLRLKDIDYALQLARQLGIGSPFGALAGEAFRTLCERGAAELNESAIIDVARGVRADGAVSIL
jgi:3-hydroxyisobutyrate dehydrogenase